MGAGEVDRGLLTFMARTTEQTMQARALRPSAEVIVMVELSEWDDERIK